MGAAPAIIAFIGCGSCFASGWFVIPIFITTQPNDTLSSHQKVKHLHRRGPAVVRDLGTQEMLPD